MINPLFIQEICNFAGENKEKYGRQVEIETDSYQGI